MAIRFDSGSTDAIRLSSSIFDYNSTYTVMAWVYPVSNPAADMQPIAVGANGSNVDRVRTGSSATAWSAQNIVGGASVVSSSTAVSYAAWQHVALVRSSTSSLDLYVDGALVGSASQSVTGRTAATEIDVGNGLAGATPFNGRIAGVKIWTVALTAAEIAQERRSLRPVRLANVWGFWPTFPGSGQRTRDYSGNGRDWTEVGTLTDEDPPPVGWGARAIVLASSGRTVSFSGTAASGSTTPTASAIRAARKLSGSAASGSTTPTASSLRAARKVSGSAASGSTTPATAAIRRRLTVSGTGGSQSSTPTTVRILSVVLFGGAAASQSTTRTTASVRVARRVGGVAGSGSSTGAIAFSPMLQPLLDRVLVVAARRSRFVVSGQRSFAVPALRRTFEAHLMAVATVPKDPAEELDFTLDYTDLLAGDPISTSVWSIDSGDAVVSSQGKTSYTTSVRLKQGTLNTKSKAKNVVVTDSGQTIVRRLVLALQEM